MGLIINPEGLKEVHDDLNDSIKMLNDYTVRLYELESLIKDEQEVAAGSLLLRLSDCGNCCAGCPHVYWDRYFIPPVLHPKSTKKLFAKTLKTNQSPLQYTKSKYFPIEARNYIKEARDLEVQRAKLVAKINSLRTTFDNHKRSNVWNNLSGENFVLAS